MPRRLLALALISLILSGCTQYVWVKPLGDPATYPQDTYTCKQESLALAPPVFQSYEIVPATDEHGVIKTDCVKEGRRERCRTIVKQPTYVPPPRAVDLNKSNRTDLFNSCMGARGWELRAVKDPE